MVHTPEAGAQSLLHSLLHVVLEPGADSQHRHAATVGQLHGGSAGELVHGIDEAQAAHVRRVLIPQILHGPERAAERINQRPFAHT